MFFSEISASLYAWDLADEGVERILDILQELTYCNSVYLIAVMHHEKRPLTDYFYPHNPVRKSYAPEDSRAYFHPDPKFYGRIKPLTSERDFLKGTDWQRVLVEAARKRGMKTGAEISHTVLDLERAHKEFPDCVQRDIYGTPLGQLVCLNNPDIVEYVSGLAADLTANYDVDYIQTCLRPFLHGRYPTLGYPNTQRRSFGDHEAGRVLAAALGGCFCDWCRKVAMDTGVDFDGIKARLRSIADSINNPTLEQSHEQSLLLASNTTAAAVLLEVPELYQWLQFRRDSVTRFFKAVHDRVHAVRDNLDLRLNAYITQNQELSGLDLRALKPHLDSIRSSDYSEQSGDINRLEHKRAWLMAVRRAVGDDMYFLSAIGTRPKATPEIVRQGVVVSAQCGVDGITIGHYDGASLSLLRAVGEGLKLADVELPAGRWESRLS